MKQKYNLADKVYLMFQNKVKTAHVWGIKIECTQLMGFGSTPVADKPVVKYRLWFDKGHEEWYDEYDLFSSKEELLSSL